ncbi:hypothetical protein [Phycicoccus sonneratiae]|uniref:Integral membrane protein n=1 Tax=Phycicoccus sonneratiae TaxID=2807628 RepID=A0ABS2CMC9_9MICO|nr:hypothetical protein [Phycicoccus sonneraticus]MBM6401024.1 hypothetical protein [Phycicoccus sonneraticus]
MDTTEGTTTDDLTPQEARERLARAEEARERRSGDRHVHGLATAGFGLLMGAYLTLSRLGQGTGWETPLLAAYAGFLVLLTLWQTRATRSWPRRARAVCYSGLAGSVVLFMAGIMTFNYREHQRELAGLAAGEDPVLLVLAGVLAALPMVLAGIVVRRGPRA